MSLSADLCIGLPNVCGFRGVVGGGATFVSLGADDFDLPGKKISSSVHSSEDTERKPFRAFTARLGCRWVLRLSAWRLPLRVSVDERDAAIARSS
jgi:hypothetical protein